MLCSFVGVLEKQNFFCFSNVFINFCNACVSRVRFIITKNKITNKINRNRCNILKATKKAIITTILYYTEVLLYLIRF